MILNYEPTPRYLSLLLEDVAREIYLSVLLITACQQTSVVVDAFVYFMTRCRLCGVTLGTDIPQDDWISSSLKVMMKTGRAIPCK
jgi:hypothetical protein